MLRFENITLFVAITHYYLFNQSLSDFAQVDVANHLKSWNEHSMSYDGVPQDWFKPWNPGGQFIDVRSVLFLVEPCVHPLDPEIVTNVERV